MLICLQLILIIDIMPIDFDKLESIQRKSTYAPKDKYKRSSFNPNAYSIDNKLLLNLRKHSGNSQNIVPGNVNAYIEARARNQSTWDRIGNALVQTVGEIVGGTIESAGSILALPSKLFGDDEAYTRNFLEQIGNSINEGTREAFPIYMTEQAQHGSLLDRMSGGGYWASIVPSILGSAASIMLPARGASLLLGKAFRSAVNLGSKSKYVKDLFKLGTKLQKAKALNRANKIADIYGSAVIGRILDSSREAYGTYEQEREWFLNNYKNYVERDENGNAILKAPGLEEVPLNDTNIESIADRYADNAASKGYWRSMSNIAYDVVEWMNILGTAKTLTKATRDNIRKAMATGDKFAIVRTLNAIPNADKGQILRAIGGFAGSSLAEMADEMTMSIAMQEGTHAARKDFGLLSDTDALTDFSMRVSSYLKDPDIWTEGIGGLLGGAGMQAIMPFIETKINKRGIEREHEYLKGIERATEAMRSGLDGIVESLAEGDIVGAKLKEQEAILNQVAANSLDGSLEFYKEMLRNMSASLKEIQSIKYKKDRGEAISAEEQIALDKGESLLANADYFEQTLNKIEAVEDIYNKHFDAVNGTTDKNLYEYQRRIATLEAQKRLNELELEAITANPAEYQKRAAESKEYLSNYVDSKYTDDNIRIAKKADINTYAENNATLEDAKAALSVHDKMIASLKKQISELENAITNAPKDATAEQLLGLKIALKGANSKLESYNKTLSDISNIRDTATKNIEALNLNKDDKEAAQQARTLLSNLTNPEEAKRFYENRRTAIDAELDYYRNGNGFEDIKDQIKLYEDEIKASTDKDLTDELNTYQTSEALQADESKFSDSDTRKAVYNARLARLQKQESDTKAANARREAALKAEQERQARQQEERDALATEEDSNAAPIGSGTFGRSYREFEGIKPLSNEASSLYNALMSESQVTDSPLANVIENRRKSKSLTSKDAMLLEEIKEFNDATNRALDNSFDTLTTTNLKWIVTRIAAKYSIFDNIFFGRRFNWIDAVTKTEVEYAPSINNGDLSAELNSYLWHLSRYTAQVLEQSGRPLPSFLADVHFGLSETTKSDINALTNKIMQEAKSMQTKFDIINNTIEDNLGRKNSKYALYVSIGGVEYRVLNTPNPRKDVGIVIEGFENQLNRYVLTPANMATPNDDYILIARQTQSSAPDQSLPPTGDYKAQQSSTDETITPKTEITETVSSANGITTEFVSDESSTNTDDAPIEFVTASNQPLIDFKIEGIDTKSMLEFLMSLMSQEGVNLALFDTDLINALVLIPKLLRNTKVGSRYASDAYIKALMNKYFTDAKLTGVETKIIETAKKVAAAVSINIDEGGNSIRLNTAENCHNATNALDNLKSLYKDESKWLSDMQSLTDALNTVYESDLVAKFAQVLTQSKDYNSNAIAIRLDETLHNKFAMIAQDLGGIFVDNFNLFGTLVAFISDRSGFRINKINYYDLVNGMREYRGDNYKELIPEIMSIMNITNYLHNEFKNRRDYYSARFAVTKDATYKELYNNYSFFYDLIDVAPTNGLPLTEAQVLDFINRTPEIKGKTYHEGLDINFSPNGAPENILGNSTATNLGIYELLDGIKEGDEVTVVQTDLEENPNRASYDVVMNRNGKEYKLGSIPKLETITNGIAYTIQGANGVYYPRKFAFTDDMAKTFAEYQRELFRFMYHYDIAFNPRNNISAKDRENSERNIDIIFDQFRKDRFKKLMDTLKELVYSNLTSKQIKDIMNSQTMIGVVDSEYTGDTDGEISIDNVALSFNQIYQICTDLFPASRINHSNMDSIMNATAITKHFNDAVNRHEMIFRNNQAIRNDIRFTGSNTFRISHISAGKILINDEARNEDHEAKHGLPIMHHRNSLLDSIKPTKDVLDSKGKPRVQILAIDENGVGKDPKTGGIVQNIDKFATPHVADTFIGNRRHEVVVIPQTDSLNTVFPIYPNTIMGSITDETEEARISKLGKYTKYIGDAIKEILALNTGNITEARLDISNRLQNIIICNERSSAVQDDIYFQSGNNGDGSKRYVMLKAVLGDGKGKEAYHKFIQTTIDGRDAVIHYTSSNKLDVANYNGALNHPSYPHTVYYLDTPADVQKFNNKLNSIIPNLVRQFGLKDGIAVAKDSTGSSYITGYTDPVTGERYEDIYDYYMATNARYSDVASVKDRYGNVISNVTIAGNAPIKFSIATKAFDTETDVPQRFYDPVELLKTVQDADRYKEDWSSISKLANILEYEAGINPVYIKHNVSEAKINIESEGYTDPVKIADDGFYRNQFRIDINYNYDHANRKEHQGYLTRTLAHEMIHTYIMKFFNATHRDINNPELLAKREALIDYNNKEWQEWFADFNQAVINTRAELTGKTDLNDRERFLKDMLSDKGIANRFIEIISQEISSISESIDTKLKDRAKGTKNVINGKDAISEIVTYSLTDPRIFRLLNELHSTTERVEGSENLKTPTFWEKFKRILLNIFEKIFGFKDTEVKTDSLMERFNDVLNRIYNKDFRDMEPDGITYGIRTNSPAPGREGAVEGSGTSAISTVESTTTEVQNAVNTAANGDANATAESPTQTTPRRRARLGTSSDSNIKASKVLTSEEASILSNALRDSKGRLLAPNGKPSNLTEDQYVKVRTKAFINWFGDWINNPNEASKVIDINGEPLVVYHGSEESFDTFDITHFGKTDNGDRGRGFYFTPNPNIASRYGSIKAFYLNIKEPYTGNQEHNLNRGKSIEDLISENAKYVNKRIAESVKHLKAQRFNSKSNLFERLGLTDNSTDAEIESKVSKYYNDINASSTRFGNLNTADGYIMNQNDVADSYEIVVFNANQIEPATDNNGDFNSNTMNTKYLKVLVDVGAKYLSDLNDNLNKNSNLDETNKRIC